MRYMTDCLKVSGGITVATSVYTSRSHDYPHRLSCLLLLCPAFSVLSCSPPAIMKTMCASYGLAKRQRPFATSAVRSSWTFWTAVLCLSLIAALSTAAASAAKGEPPLPKDAGAAAAASTDRDILKENIFLTAAERASSMRDAFGPWWSTLSEGAVGTTHLLFATPFYRTNLHLTMSAPEVAVSQAEIAGSRPAWAIVKPKNYLPPRRVVGRDRRLASARIMNTHCLSFLSFSS